MEQLEHEDRLASAVDSLTDTVERLNAAQTRKNYWPHIFGVQIILMSAAFVWQQYYFAFKIEARRRQSEDFLKTMEAIEGDVSAIKIEMSDYMTTHFLKMGPEHRKRAREELNRIHQQEIKGNATQ